MKTTVTPIEENKVRLEIEVPIDELGPAMDRAARDLSRGLNLKGFRSGKIPRKVLERHIGREAIADEARRYAVPQFLADAVVAEEIDFIGRPEVESVSGGLDDALSFTATLDTRPKLDIPELSGLTVRLETSTEPSDDDIAAEIDALRKRFATTETVERAATEGDYVLINLEVYVHDERFNELSRTDFLYEIGSDLIVPALDTELIGAEAGAIVKFDADLPDTLPIHAGEEASFSVMVKEVKAAELPELTDDWVGESSEFDTVDELRAELVETMKRMRFGQAFEEAQAKTIEALVEATGLAVPESVIDEEVDARITNAARDLQRRGITLEQYFEITGDSPEAMRERFQPDAVTAVNASLVLRAVAESAEITADDDEINAEVQRFADQTGRQFSRVRKELAKAGQLSQIASSIIRAKALRHLLDNVSVVDADGRPVDLTAQAAAVEIEPSFEAAGEPDIEDVSADDAVNEAADATAATDAT